MLASNDRMGGEPVCIVFPDGSEVMTVLDDRGTLDFDCLHPHALGLQEYPHLGEGLRPSGPSFAPPSSSPAPPSGGPSSLGQKYVSHLRPPMCIGRDAQRPSRSDPWAPLFPRRRYRLLLHPSPPPFSCFQARRHSTEPRDPFFPPSHVSYLGNSCGCEPNMEADLREVKALLQSLLAATTSSAATSAHTTSSSTSGVVDATSPKLDVGTAAANTSTTITADTNDRISVSIPSPAPTNPSTGRGVSVASNAEKSESTHKTPPSSPTQLLLERIPSRWQGCCSDSAVPVSEAAKRSKRKEGKQRRPPIDGASSSSSSTLDNGEASGEIVRVNVGGKEFITLRSTMCRFEGSFLEAICSGRHRSVHDSMGRLFIDRNPEHFQVILDFLRDPTMTCPELPSQKEERQAYLREVEYYGLKEVMVGEKKEAELLCEQGYAFYNGRKVSKDYRKAVELWQRAAELGEARAQNRLAMCYKNGEGVEQDLYKAIPLFQKAAEQGLRDAQYNLACIYKNGEGVGIDLKKAIFWFQRAEAQGDTDARRMLETLAK